MKRIFNFFAVAAVIAFAAACNGPRGGKAAGDADTLVVDTTAVDTAAVAEVDVWANLPEEPLLDVKTNMGTLTIKLYGKTPKHRDNFVKLAKTHYYDSLLFHRVIPGFMIQCGDPESRHAEPGARLGSGGPGYTIPAEFVKEYYHKKGALAAARQGDMVNPYKESSGSQFYIVQDETSCIHLDDNYTVFGETVKGLEIVDRIAFVETDRFDRPVKDVVILSIAPNNDQPAE